MPRSTSARRLRRRWSRWSVGSSMTRQLSRLARCGSRDLLDHVASDLLADHDLELVADAAALERLAQRRLVGDLRYVAVEHAGLHGRDELDGELLLLLASLGQLHDRAQVDDVGRLVLDDHGPA